VGAGSLYPSCPETGGPPVIPLVGAGSLYPSCPETGGPPVIPLVGASEYLDPFVALPTQFHLNLVADIGQLI